MLLVNWDTRERRSVDRATLLKAVALGWKWITDVDLQKVKDKFLNAR
jgi:hypothetical protein